MFSVPSDKKDALICADKIYREAVAAAERRTLAAEAPGGKKKTKSGKSSDAHSGKRTSPECCATVEDAPSSSTGKCKKAMVAPPETKKVTPRRMALVVPLPSAPLLTPNRKMRSLLSCGRMLTCLHGNRLISPVFPGK